VERFKDCFYFLASKYETDKNIKFYEKIARKLLLNLKQVLDSQLKNQKEVSILELGAGTGIFSKLLIEELTKRFQKFKVFSVDLSKEMLFSFKNRLIQFEENVFPVVGDVRELRFKKSFDMVVGNFCLHWFFSKKFVESCFKLLKPGGLVAFSVPVSPCKMGRGNLILTKILHEISNSCAKDLRKTLKFDQVLLSFKEVKGFSIEKLEFWEFKEIFYKQEFWEVLESRGSIFYLFGEFASEAERVWRRFYPSLPSKLFLEWKILFFVVKKVSKS